MNIELARGGPSVSPVVLGVMKWGAWGHQMSPEAMRSLVEESLDMGVSTFDHADIYGHYTTEAEFGNALKHHAHLRQRMQIVTKCGIRLVTPNRPEHRLKSYDTDAAYIRRSVEQSLRNLATDYIDLLLIHRPDPLMNPDEVAHVFRELQQEGKVLHFGASNFSPAQFDMMHDRIPLVTNQVQASAMFLEPFLDGTFDQSLRLRLRPMAWAPLGGSQFFTDLEDPKVHRLREVLKTICAEKGGIPEDQLMLAFLVRHPAGIVPVIGTSNAARVRSAVAALGISLSREEWFSIWSASTGAEVP